MGNHPQDRGAGRLTHRSSEDAQHPGRDTIAAIATSAGRAGIGVVRVSGPLVSRIARKVLRTLPRPRRATLCDFLDPAGVTIDTGIALLFVAPASYTGEDVLELQAHGSRAVLDMILESVLACGARLARGGEFTERAFLEGRLDLLQAEAVADLIDASSVSAARAAQATLRGEFSVRVNALVARLTATRARLEASLDFADEDLGIADDTMSRSDLDVLVGELEASLSAARQGVRLRDGLRVALIGPPNAGKSSIMNRLAGEPRAIVTPVPGTTRDVLREVVRINGATVELFDTAGLRDSNDDVERAGIERAREQAALADLLLVVCDETRTDVTALLEGVVVSGSVVKVRNKIDLTAMPAGIHAGQLHVSALTGAGFEDLVAVISDRASSHAGEGSFTARLRHVQELERARAALEYARRLDLEQAGVELVAEELRQAQVALGRITGEVTSDDLLGEIFASFCIGK